MIQVNAAQVKRFAGLANKKKETMALAKQRAHEMLVNGDLQHAVDEWERTKTSVVKKPLSTLVVGGKKTAAAPQVKPLVKVYFRCCLIISPYC